MHGAAGIAVKRIDREIAARGVCRPIPRERNGRMPAVGGDVAPQGCDFMGDAMAHDSHSAVLQPGRDDLQPRSRRHLHDLLGRRRRGDVDVGHGFAHQRVAHGATDDPALMASVPQGRQNGLRLGPGQPGRVGE